MSILLAIRDGERVCMASDAQMTNNGSRSLLDRPKFTRKGSLLIGWPSLAIADWVDYFMPDPPSKFASTDWDLRQWVAREFIPALRKHSKETELLENGPDGEKLLSGHCLLARGSEIVLADAAGGTVTTGRPWYSMGSGRDAADGAIYAMFKLIDEESRNVEHFAQTAVLAACALDTGCAPPIYHEWTT